MILPNNIFFSPNENFLDWAKENLRGKTIIECGAGTGHLSKKLQSIDLSVLPIDMCDREETETTVIKKNAETFDYPENSIVIMARPNRGDWINNTINKALTTASYLLYIGLKEHVEEDILSLPFEIETILENAGKDNETVFKICKKTRSKMKTKHYLVQQNLGSNPDCPLVMIYWLQDKGNKWVHSSNGCSWMPKEEKQKILETAEVEDIHELDWTKTSLIDNKHNSGWIDRNGHFYGCTSQNHDIVADLVFNKTVEEMEKQGYVRVYGSDSWVCQRKLTPEQRITLIEKNHIVKDED
jgi:hypothetical protein